MMGWRVNPLPRPQSRRRVQTVRICVSKSGFQNFGSVDSAYEAPLEAVHPIQVEWDPN